MRPGGVASSQARKPVSTPGGIASSRAPAGVRQRSTTPAVGIAADSSSVGEPAVDDLQHRTVHDDGGPRPEAGEPEPGQVVAAVATDAREPARSAFRIRRNAGAAAQTHVHTAALDELYPPYDQTDGQQQADDEQDAGDELR